MSENREVDKISQLPDDVLVAIISRLTWREAIATSILCTRWRHLYTYITRLSYSTRHPSEQSKDKYFQQLQEKEFPKHMKETYDFLASNKDCRFLEEFKLHIPCLKGGNIKRWLPLVLEKEVESIDTRIIYHNKAMPGYYTFPRKTLIKRKGGDLGLFPGLKSLRKLSLRSLHVDDRDVELFVSNCTVLEHLSIVGSYRLKKVSLVGHLKLKSLEISSSRNVTSIEVHSPSIQFYSKMSQSLLSSTHPINFTYLATSSPEFRLPFLINYCTLMSSRWNTLTIQYGHPFPY